MPAEVDIASPLDDLSRHLDRPATIRSVELLKVPQAWLCRVIDADGDAGVAACTSRLEVLWPIFAQQVAPAAVGRDARKPRELTEATWRYAANYKLGLAARSCLAGVEMACIDLVGKKANRSVGRMANRRHRDHVDVYLSHTGRGTTAEQEVELFAPRIEETGCRAIKYKVGGRMSHNADAAPGRSEKVTRALREAFFDVELWADANGSYDAEHAIGLGQMLAGYNVAVFEEPCPFDDLDATHRVADALAMPVAGGEQDVAWPLFDRIAAGRIVDIVQPDAHYVGGLGRLLRVAKLANDAGLAVAPHSPKSGPEAVALLHAASLIDHPAAFHEWSVHPPAQADWYEPALTITDGRIAVPDGPGLGITYDDAVLASAKVVASAA